ncbi:MAG: ABC transporter permease [Streptosporangiales bacterium]|nr:ABC transporter permease [Streptosporangiales bacterium]
MMRAIAAFGRHDLRTIRRDSLMIVVLVGPFLYAAAMWLVPALTDFAATRWDFDLVPYYSLIITPFPILGPPLLLGALLGFQLLDDKDQNTLTALRVTPVPPAVYPAYRAVSTIVLTTVTVVAALALTGLASAEVVAKSAAVGLVGGLVAVICGLLMAAFPRNKVEGIAIMRVIGLVMAVPPLLPFFFLDSPWQLAFGIIPPYWPARAFWSAMDGGAFWPYILGGLAYNSALALVLLRVLGRRFG